MDAKKVIMVKAYLTENDTAELLEIWNKNDRKSYTDEAFEAIRLILKERGVAAPEQPVYVPIVENINPEPKESRRLDADLEIKRKLQTESGKYLEKAYTYKESNKFEDALREADAAIKLDSSLEEAHNLRGIALEELGHHRDAIEAYKQAISLNPKFREAKNNLSDLEEYLIEQHQLEPGEIYTDPNKKYELVTIATFTHPIEAHIAKSILDREGIWAFIAGENFNRLYPLTEGGLKLRVRQPDAAKAFDLLNAETDGVRLLDEELGQDEQRETCPNCQSPLIHYEKYNVGFTFLLLLLLRIPLLVLKRKWVCSACGHEWESKP